MDNILNDEFTKQWDSEDNQRIMNKVANHYSKNLDFDDIESAKMSTLWHCIQKYDESRGSKFTSYLFQQLNFAMRNLYKQKKKDYNMVQYNNPPSDGAVESDRGVKWSAGSVVQSCAEEGQSDYAVDAKSQQYRDCYDIVTGLDDEDAQIIRQRFYENLTMKEIGVANGYSRETARRRVKRAIDSCKESAL